MSCLSKQSADKVDRHTCMNGKSWEDFVVRLWRQTNYMEAGLGGGGQKGSLTVFMWWGGGQAFCKVLLCVSVSVRV